jgi:GT2 family glycosyltransferase
MVKNEIPDCTIIRGKGDWWWGGALHQGYKWIRNKKEHSDSFVLILNDDTEFETDFLRKGINIIKNIPGTIIQAEPYGKRSGKLSGQGMYFDFKKLSFLPAQKSQEINCLTTRGLLMHTKDFIKIGGFYPRILPHYLSDMEYTIRASQKGLKLITHPEFKLIMLEDETGYGEVNELSFKLFLKKHYAFKNMMNPIHWIAFVFLICPFPYNFKNLWVVIKREYFILLEQWYKFKSTQ